jgi:methionyl aminopeptidase
MDSREMACSRPLEDGDIINIDLTVFLDGYHGDTSETFLVGDVVRGFLGLVNDLLRGCLRMNKGSNWSM